MTPWALTAAKAARAETKARSLNIFGELEIELRVGVLPLVKPRLYTRLATREFRARWQVGQFTSRFAEE